MHSMNCFLKIALVIASVDFILMVQSIVGQSPCTPPKTAMVTPLISQFIDKKFNIFAQTLINGTACQAIVISGTGNPPISGLITISGTNQTAQAYTWTSYSNGSLTYQVPYMNAASPDNYYLFLVYNNGGSSQSCAVKICPDGGSPNILLMSTASSLSAQEYTALENQAKGADSSLATVAFNKNDQSNCGSN